jgi:hypothetical protein
VNFDHPEKNLPPDKWLRVGNEGIKINFFKGKKIFWEVRRAFDPSRPPLPPPQTCFVLGFSLYVICLRDFVLDFAFVACWLEFSSLSAGVCKKKEKKKKKKSHLSPVSC